MNKRVAKKTQGLDSWHGIIERQGEAMRKAQSKKVAAMRKGLKAQIKALKDHTDEHLLDILLHARDSQHCMDLGERSVWEELYVAARRETINRMA